MSGFQDDEEITEYIREKAGDLGLSLCQLIESGANTIIEMAEAMGMPRRATRQVLYLLNKERIIGYKRIRRDRKIMFVWFLTPKKIKRMITTTRQAEIRRLEEDIEFEQDHKFFVCEPCHERYLYTEAFEFDFTCEHCGADLEHQDTAEKVIGMRKKLKELIEVENLSKQDIDEAPEIIGEELDDPLETDEPDEEERPIKRPKRKKVEEKEEDHDIEVEEDPFDDVVTEDDDL